MRSAFSYEQVTGVKGLIICFFFMGFSLLSLLLAFPPPGFYSHSG